MSMTMNLAVKFWKDVPNPRGIPSDWPAECREIGAATSYPGGWTIMTLTEYEDYVAYHQAQYDAWEAANPEPMRPEGMADA